MSKKLHWGFCGNTVTPFTLSPIIDKDAAEVKLNVSSKGVEYFLRPLQTVSSPLSSHSHFPCGFSHRVLALGGSLGLSAEANLRHDYIGFL